MFDVDIISCWLSHGLPPLGLFAGPYKNGAAELQHPIVSASKLPQSDTLRHHFYCGNIAKAKLTCDKQLDVAFLLYHARGCLTIVIYFYTIKIRGASRKLARVAASYFKR